MRAVVCQGTGEPDVLDIADLPDPEPGAGEVVIEIHAAGVNRADLLQRRGRYPPPPGASDVLGLECSGIVRKVGSGVDRWREGDEVCALLSGGGYAEQVAVPAGQVLAVPKGVDLPTAAGLPEVAATVWSNVFMLAGLRAGETVLVHGAAGGVGTMAVQLGKACDAQVIAVAGTPERLERCRELGADLGINRRESDFVDALREATDGRGADVIVDNMGAEYLPRNVAAMAPAGRLVVIGLQGGAVGELPLAALLAKRGAVLATSLRGRPDDEKAAIMASVEEHVWPLIGEGTVQPVIDTVFDLDQVADAHRAVEAGDNIGKVLLRTHS